MNVTKNLKKLMNLFQTLKKLSIKLLVSLYFIDIVVKSY